MANSAVSTNHGKRTHTVSALVRICQPHGVCDMQSRSQASSQQEPKSSSYFGGAADQMQDLPALPKADTAAGLACWSPTVQDDVKCMLCHVVHLCALMHTCCVLCVCC